jgi:hypothetical protein
VVLYLNLDGVLHPNAVRFSSSSPFLESCGRHLFENVDALVSVSTESPDLRFILNTWWTYHIHFDDCLKQLLASVPKRVIGAVLSHSRLCARLPNRDRWLRKQLELPIPRSYSSTMPMRARYPRHILVKAFLVDPIVVLGDSRAVDALTWQQQSFNRE